MFNSATTALTRSQWTASFSLCCSHGSASEATFRRAGSTVQTRPLSCSPSCQLLYPGPVGINRHKQCGGRRCGGWGGGAVAVAATGGIGGGGVAVEAASRWSLTSELRTSPQAAELCVPLATWRYSARRLYGHIRSKRTAETHPVPRLRNRA